MLNNDSLLVIDFTHPLVSVSDYSGWSFNRRFLPCLVVTNEDNLPIVFEGYETVWQLLDVICWKNPLGRNNFNPILKHRLEGFDETSLDIIRGVFSEGDVQKITVQGSYKNENTFSVDHTYTHYEDQVQPSLMWISSILEDNKSEMIIFDNFEYITRTSKNENKRVIQTLPSIIALIPVKKYAFSENVSATRTIIRAVEMPNGKIGMFSNIIIDGKKHSGFVPQIFAKDEVKNIVSYIRKSIDLSELVLREKMRGAEIPEWKQKVTAGSTVSHYTYNYRCLEAALTGRGR